MTTNFGWLDAHIATAELIEYKDWVFYVGVDEYLVPFLQIRFLDDGEWQYCRKWLLYRTMNVSEFVRTVWLAVLAAEEHEARESFFYKGKRVMSPHIDFDKIAERGLPVAPTEDPR